MRYLVPLIVVLGLFLCGCGPAVTPEVKTQADAVAQKAADNPAVGKLLGSILTLAKDGLNELARYGEKLMRRQELQSQVRHWLLALAVASGLFALGAGAGKLVGKAGSLWTIPLVWLSEQVSWKTIAIAGAVCAGCVYGAIWIAPLWRYGLQVLQLAGGAALFYAGWAASARIHTGPWKPDGLVRLPAGWKVAPKG